MARHNETLGTLWDQIPGTEIYEISEPGVPYVIAGREYDDADNRRGQMLYWGVYGDGIMQPPTASGWAKSAGHAQRAAVRALTKWTRR